MFLQNNSITDTSLPTWVGNTFNATFLGSSVSNGLTAVGTDRATGLALTSQINVVATAGAGTGVVLPPIADVGIGTSVVVFNAGVNPIKVYGDGTNTVDGGASATLTNAKRAVFIPTAAGTWISAQLGVVSA